MGHKNCSPFNQKFGYYKLFDHPNNHCFKVQNEFDLHTKVVDYIRKFCKNAIINCSLGELQDTNEKRINSWKMGYQKGSPDIIIMNHHKRYTGFCIEFKSPTNKYQISEAQKRMKRLYKMNGYLFKISNDYDQIIKTINKYMKYKRLPCRYCSRKFKTEESLLNHKKYIHKFI